MLNNIIQYFQESDTYQVLDVVGTIIGLVYIYQEYKASIWLWFTSIVMPAVYTFVYYEAKLYADFAMQIYYIIVSIYGFLYWQFGKRQKDDKELPITRFPKRKIIPTMVLFLALWGAVYYILITFTNSNVPVLDSFGNSLSIIGLWALAKKYLEQWWIWFVADIELSALYFYKSIPFTAALYALYALIAIAGYFKWKRMMQTTVQTSKEEQ